MSELLQTPERHLSDGLDFYKLTMGQLALEKFPDAQVTFTLNNRGKDFPLNEYVTRQTLEQRIREIQERGFDPEEIEYFRSLRASNGEQRFDEAYLSYLEHLVLPDVIIEENTQTGDFDIHTTGPWPTVSLWETVVMSELNELYFEGKIQKEELDIEALYDEGDERLSKKIEILKQRPDIKFADFGTRRRFSAQWQEHVIGRLAKETPDNLLGTSNPWFAKRFGIKPIGTYAHEMPMVYAAIRDGETAQPLDGHNEMIQDWINRYGKDLSIALTDTFTTEFFFDDFGKEGAKNWNGLRHDSGDPYEFGEKTIEFYKKHGINPMDRTIVFSDGLDIEQIVELTDYFSGKINVVYGWGTTLTNDLGLRANNFVMKATNVNGIDTVKLSDNPGKHTGPDSEVARYQAEVALKRMAVV